MSHPKPITRILAILLVALVFPLALAARPAAAAAGSARYFWVHCLPAQVTPTDPIEYPGGTADQSYVFFGNTATSQNSTPASLRSAGARATSCSTSTDTAAYWAPQLELFPGESQTYHAPGFGCAALANGNTACTYTNVRAYYGLAGSARAQITNFPASEAAAAGGDVPGPAGKVPGPGGKEVTFSCGGSSPFEYYPYDCTSYINTSGNADQDGVVIRAVFPRCWDGTGTAPTDFTYPPCAAGDKVLPLLNVHFHTGIVTPCPGRSCPPGSTVAPAFGFVNTDGSVQPWNQFHAGFMNGWQEGDGGLSDLVTDCLIHAAACPSNPRTSPARNMPT